MSNMFELVSLDIERENNNKDTIMIIRAYNIKDPGHKIIITFGVSTRLNHYNFVYIECFKTTQL